VIYTSHREHHYDRIVRWTVREAGKEGDKEYKQNSGGETS